jgi:hypothetical protein
MIAYVILAGMAGPWPTSSAPITSTQVAHAFDPGAFGLAVFLAWRVTRGSSLARGLLVLYTTAGLAGTLASPGMRSGNLISVWLPPRWLLVTTVAVGLIVTLISLGGEDYQPVSGCQAPGYSAAHGQPLTQCGAWAEGFPVHYLSAIPDLSLSPGNKLTVANLDLAANPVIDKSAAVKDLTVWTLISFAALYLPQHRLSQGWIEGGGR